jgi:hypothetical protein
VVREHESQLTRGRGLSIEGLRSINNIRAGWPDICSKVNPNCYGVGVEKTQAKSLRFDLLMR